MSLAISRVVVDAMEEFEAVVVKGEDEKEGAIQMVGEKVAMTAEEEMAATVVVEEEEEVAAVAEAEAKAALVTQTFPLLPFRA